MGYIEQVYWLLQNGQDGCSCTWDTTIILSYFFCVLLSTVVPHIDRHKVTSEITFERGSTVRLDCPSVGRPVPTIKWTSLTTNKSVDRTFLDYRRINYRNGSLLLKYLRDGDEGVYMCTAVNDVGSDSVNITLISKEAELRRELEGMVVDILLLYMIIYGKINFKLS